MNTRERTLLKQDEVLGGFRSEDYTSERRWATARGGTRVPVSIVYRKGTPLDGTSPGFLYAYGSYGSSTDAAFRSPFVSLLNRGFVCAIAHVRGGQELGRAWYEDGKLLNKKNTFTDFIDVAEIYPVPPDAKYAGASEEICGKWLADRPRDSVYVATKVTGPFGGWFQAPVRSGKTSLDRHHIERAVEGSLRRLRIDYIDLYQTHWPDPGVPIEETLEALDRLVEEGKVRAIGCSNETAYGVTKGLWMSERNGFARYQTIQNNYSLLNRRFEDELATVCRREKLSLLAYSPLGGGVLSGKYQDGAWPEGQRFSLYKERDARTQAMTARFVNERTLEAAARLGEVARDCGMSLVTFAIASLYCTPWEGADSDVMVGGWLPTTGISTVSLSVAESLLEIGSVAEAVAVAVFERVPVAPGSMSQVTV